MNTLGMKRLGLALLLTTLVPEADAALLRCATGDGIPLYTDTPVNGQEGCVEYAPDRPRFSVNKGLQVGQVPRGRSARTRREIERARRSRQALQEAREKRQRACQRARTRAAAAWPLPLQRRKQLNLAAFHACQ